MLIRFFNIIKKRVKHQKQNKIAHEQGQFGLALIFKLASCADDDVARYIMYLCLPKAEFHIKTKTNGLCLQAI